ncbi:MAG: peptide/nickel transport system permease protein [Candidatus Omnitrophota bacterium]|jgi:peptide/nickel transport system permease protein
MNKTLTRIALAWIGLIGICALGASFLAPYDPGFINVTQALDAPSWAHWMGTDHLGRDVLSRLMHGAKVSFEVGFLSVGISTIIGVAIGAISGYWGRWVDKGLMAFVDIMLCFPAFFLILSVIAIVDEPGIGPIILIIGLTSWMGTARLVRAEVLTLKEREFVIAAKVLGTSHWRMLIKQLIPNAMGPVWVTMTLGVASAILVESGLSFLGIGVQPPHPSWGNVLTDGKAALGVAWWLTLSPGLCILFTVLSYNIAGEALRTKLNVKK